VEWRIPAPKRGSGLDSRRKPHKKIENVLAVSQFADQRSHGTGRRAFENTNAGGGTGGHDMALQPFATQRVGSAVALGCIGAALWAGGAGEAAPAAAFGAALAVLLAAEVALLPASRLAEAARLHLLPLTAALAFAAWTATTAWLSDAGSAPDWRRALWHPLWREFDASRGAISISPYRTWEGLAAFAGPAAAFALGALNTQDRRERDWTGRLMTALGIALAGSGLLQFAAERGAGEFRLMAGLGSANAAATLFGALALFMSALLIRGVRNRLSGARPAKDSLPPHPLLAPLQTSPVTLAAFALTMACVLLTGSRAGLIALIGAFALLFVYTRAGASAAAPERNRVHAAFGALAALAAVLLLLGGQLLIDRLGSIRVDAETRQIMIDTHWRAFLDRPVLGHGLNTFHEINAHYSNPDNWAALRQIGAAHNVFVQMLEETGLIGGLLFALMLGPPLWRASILALTDRSGAEWAAAACAAFAFALAHGAVDFGLQVPAIAALLAYALGAFSTQSLSPRASQ
jgi:O-antigen ligase